MFEDLAYNLIADVLVYGMFCCAVALFGHFVLFGWRDLRPLTQPSTSPTILMVPLRSISTSASSR